MAREHANQVWQECKYDRSNNVLLQQIHVANVPPPPPLLGQQGHMVRLIVVGNRQRESEGESTIDWYYQMGHHHHYGSPQAGRGGSRFRGGGGKVRETSIISIINIYNAGPTMVISIIYLHDSLIEDILIVSIVFYTVIIVFLLLLLIISFTFIVTVLSSPGFRTEINGLTVYHYYHNTCTMKLIMLYEFGQNSIWYTCAEVNP